MNDDADNKLNTLVNQLYSDVNKKFDHILDRTTPLEDLPGHLKSAIGLLLGPGPNKARNQFFATILNAMYTEKMTEFLMSTNLLQRLIKDDSNVSRKTVDSKAYREFYAYVDKNKFVDVLEKPQQIGAGKKALAGRWKWIHEPSLELLKTYWLINEDSISLISENVLDQSLAHYKKEPLSTFLQALQDDPQMARMEMDKRDYDKKRIKDELNITESSYHSIFGNFKYLEKTSESSDY